MATDSSFKTSMLRQDYTSPSWKPNTGTSSPAPPNASAEISEGKKKKKAKAGMHAIGDMKYRTYSTTSCRCRLLAASGHWYRTECEYTAGVRSQHIEGTPRPHTGFSRILTHVVCKWTYAFARPRHHDKYTSRHGCRSAREVPGSRPC
jgi:hypothetical protein